MRETTKGKTEWTQARLAGAGALICALAASAAIPAEEMVVGRVVDAAGRPVAGAQVGTSFQLADTPEKMKLQISYADPPVPSDARGGFSIPAAKISYTKAIVARKGKLIGVALRNGMAPVQIRLAPAAHLDITLVKRFGSVRQIGVDLVKGGSVLGYGNVTRRASWALPQGAFELVLSQAEIRQTTRPVTLRGQQRKAITITPQPTSWAKNLGKPAPALTPTELRNARDVSPAALRGKWVLVDYWATWCMPCVQAMPKLIAFYAAHAKERDKFEIVAVYAPDGKSFAAIQPSYNTLIEKAWAGKSLPFPLVFDSSGATHKRWGIESYPTTLLIDPQGRLVGTATIDDLAKKIG
jgi:thiol-disulfide isomerase/thioredoxin